MITYTHHTAGNLPIKTLVAKQRPTKYICTILGLRIKGTALWFIQPIATVCHLITQATSHIHHSLEVVLLLSQTLLVQLTYSYVLAFSPDHLDHWLTHFVLEARHKDGKPYPPHTLHQLVCGILRYVREIKPIIDIF